MFRLQQELPYLRMGADIPARRHQEPTATNNLTWRGKEMINEPPKPITDTEKIALLRESATNAYEFIENYCSCNARNVVAKDLRRALEATK